MADPCTVLIAAAALLPVLTPRASTEGHELLAFSDQDTLRALDAITGRRPARVTLDESFAATPRGSALIKRIKADPALASVDVRIVNADAIAAVDAAAPRESGENDAPSIDLPEVEGGPLDPVGTRRVPRINVEDALEVLIDGNPALLVDLSTIGAQVLSPTVLKPNQRVRVAFSDPAGSVRMSGTIVWACFEIPPDLGPRYRAGVEFTGGDTEAMAVYCRRYTPS